MGNKYIMRSCYWCNEYQDMNATVPTCDYYGQYGSCPCSDECEHYISEQEVEKIIRKRADAVQGEWIKATGMMPPEFHGHHCCSECGNFANMEPPFGNRGRGMKRKDIAKIIYEELCYMYCDNCRYNSEIGEDAPDYGCDDCHRKYNGWGISMAEAERIAEMIGGDTE